MEKNQFVLEYGFDGPRREFVTEEEAREFQENNPDLSRQFGDPHLRVINPSDSDVGMGDGRL